MGPQGPPQGPPKPPRAPPRGSKKNVLMKCSLCSYIMNSQAEWANVILAVFQKRRFSVHPFRLGIHGTIAQRQFRGYPHFWASTGSPMAPLAPPSPNYSPIKETKLRMCAFCLRNRSCVVSDLGILRSGSLKELHQPTPCHLRRPLRRRRRRRRRRRGRRGRRRGRPRRRRRGRHQRRRRRWGCQVLGVFHRDFL